eukprot:7390277-Prymnesium_polylepis.1
MLPSELSDNTTCVGYGLSDAALYAARDAIMLSSPYTSSDTSVFLPVFSSMHADDGDSPSHAVIWIHGLSGDANTYYCSGVSATHDRGDSENTLSIAPWFGDEQLTLEAWLGTAAAARWRSRHALDAASST